MSAVEQYVFDPERSRRSLRALPAVSPVSEDVSFEPLLRLAGRVLPQVVLVVQRMSTGRIVTWPSGVMGRRSSVERLAGVLLERVSAAGELWVPSIAGDAALACHPELREAGPLAVAILPLLAVEQVGALAALREEGEWSESERDTLRDVAAAIAQECARDGASDASSRSPGPSSERRPLESANSPSPAWWIPVGALLSGVCHELNNPLTSIKSFAELLLLDARSDDDREALEIVQREAHRAARIVGDLRLVARRSIEDPAFGVGTPRFDEVVREVLEGCDEPPAALALRVLIVDEEAPIRFSLARYLERRGHEVEQACDGHDAMHAIARAERDGGYDVVLADHRMPALGGIALLARLREAHPAAAQRLIFMTGSADGTDAAQALEETGLPVVRKPLELPEVAQVVEAHARLLAG